MRRLAFVAALLVAPLGAQGPAKPKAVEELDAKILGEVAKIVRTDFDVSGKVVWLVESKGPAAFPPLVARFFDADDVEFDARFVDFQHSSRVTGERTRVSLVLPGRPDSWARVKRIVIAIPVTGR